MENVEKKEVPQISKAGFTADVESGMNKAELVTKYGVSPASISEIAKQLDLKIKPKARTVAPKFILLDDAELEAQPLDVSSTESLN